MPYKRGNPGACGPTYYTCGTCTTIPAVLNGSLVFTPMIAGCVAQTPITVTFTLTYDTVSGRWLGTIALTNLHNSFGCGITGIVYVEFYCTGIQLQLITYSSGFGAGTSYYNAVGGAGAVGTPTVCLPFSWSKSVAYGAPYQPCGWTLTA